MKCQYFIPSKQRQCLNDVSSQYDYDNDNDSSTAAAETKYCKLHHRMIMNYIDHQITQDGGAGLLSKILKSKKLISSGSKAFSKLEEGIQKAEKMSTMTKQLSSVGTSMTQSSASSGGMNPNYANPDIIMSRPLGSPAVSGNYQRFGDHICIKTSFIEDIRNLLYELFAKRDIVPGSFV